MLLLFTALLHQAFGDPAGEQGNLQIQLYVRDGYFAVDSTNSIFTPAPFFPTDAAGTLKIKKQLYSALDDTLKNLGPAAALILVYQTNCFPNYPKSLDSPFTNVASVLHFTNDWSGAYTKLVSWAKSNNLKPQPAGLQTVYYGTILSALEQDLSTNLPVICSEAGQPAIVARKHAQTGLVSFKVIYFSTNNLDQSRFLITAAPDMFKAAGITTNNLARLTSGLVGQPWSAAKLHRLLDDAFVRMGYDVAVDSSTEDAGAVLITPCIQNLTASQPGAGVKLEGSPQLDKILILEPRTNLMGLTIPLYQIMPWPDFLQLRKAIIDTNDQADFNLYPTNTTKYTVEVTELAFTNSAWANLAKPRKNVNQSTMTDQLKALGSAGYQATLYSDPAADIGGKKFARLVLIPPGGIPLKTGTVSNTAPGTNVLAGASRTNLAPDSASAPAAEKYGRTLVTNFTHQLQFDFTVNPRQDPGLGLRYTEGNLVGTNTALSAGVAWQDQPSGEASYSKSWIAQKFLFGWSPTLSIQGGSDYYPDRQITNSLVNERRSGGSVLGTLEIFRDWSGSWLASSLNAGANAVADGTNNSLSQRQTIATLDAGLNYFLLRDGTICSPTFQLQPHLLLGYSTSNSVWFVRPSVTTSYHQLIPNTWLEWDSRSSVAWSSHETPIVELPSFGGETSVRGFRDDASQGHLSWALQNELWLPLRYDFGLPDAVDQFIRRNSHLAAFVDVGGLHESTSSLEGFKAGAGLGLRVTYQIFTLRLDWAHSLENVDHRFGGNTFYFSTTVRPSF